MQIPTFATVATVGLAAVTNALPTATNDMPSVADEAWTIEQIMPKSASCDGKAEECRTATQAAPHIYESFRRYGIYGPNATAAVLSLIAVESDELGYKHNAFPGRPGQGTCNMQMPNYNLQYAKSIEAVAPKVSQYTAVDGLSDEQLNEILGYLTSNDEYNFGSAAWFLRKVCGEPVIQALMDDVDDGFKQYMKCIDVEVSEGRQEYFDKAKAVFNL